MAVSVSDVTPNLAGKRLSLAKITFDSSYPSGGEAVTAADFGLTYLENVVPLGAPDGFSFEYDVANSKLLAYWVDTSVDGAAQAQVANTTDLSAVAGWFLGIGT